MGDYDDYYYNDDDNTFSEYNVTSVDPGYDLLMMAVGYSICCLLISFLCKCCLWKNKEAPEGQKKSNSAERKHNRPPGSSNSDSLSEALQPAEAERKSPPGGNGNDDDDASFRNALRAGLLEFSESKDFDFVFVDKTPSARTNGARKWRNHMSRSVKSRQKSISSRSNISVGSLMSESVMNDDNVAPLDKSNKKRSTSAKSEQKSESLEAAVATSSSSYQELVNEEIANDNRTVSPQAEQVTYKSELRHMMKLAGPWAFGSFVLSTASIVTIGVISHYIGTAEMICYGYVWFFMDAAHIMSSAMYTSLYKHANNAKALGTQEGYNRAGKYIRIAIIFNFFTSVPIAFILTSSVGPIMRLYGYGNRIANLSQKYTLLACASNFISTTTGFVSIIPDLEGHADFDAVYSLVDSVIDITITLFLIPVLRPSLLGLGVIHIIQDVSSIIVYYFITGYFNGWYSKYLNGIFGRLNFTVNYCRILGSNKFEGKDKNLVLSLVKKTIPITFDVFTGEVEWFVLTVFAAYLGSAEAATLVLISYIWGFVGILPSNVASAFEYRISNLLSNGNQQLARRMASTSMWLTTVLSAISCGILYIASGYIVDWVTNDEVLHDMLLEIIPYIVLCDPLIAPSTAASYLNRALAMYQRSAKVELLMTLLITIPAATLSTYVMGYNIEGIIAALYASYATMGIVILYVYYNGDWDRAIVKNQKMSGDCDEEMSVTDSNSGDENSNKNNG